MISPYLFVLHRFAAAFAEVAGEAVDPVVRRSQHADFQVDGALPLAARLRRPPRDIAADVLARLDRAGLATAEVSGPGFINVRLADAGLTDALAQATVDDRLGVPLTTDPERVLVDYSSPNAAKELHVGHLRSTVIGDAIARLLTWIGHDVRRANHLGDWGTPFAMLLEHLAGLGDTLGPELSIGDFTELYRTARRSFDGDPAFAERSRQRVVALQSGDATTVRLWRRLVRQSQDHLLAMYRRMDITLTADDFRGESFYHDHLSDVVAALRRDGLVRESEGALCAFPAGFIGRDGEPMPLIVQKSDGGFGYAATDLAAIRYRTAGVGATRILYVVGTEQRQHLAMVFQTAREAGWLTEPARAIHVEFGQILGPYGKKLASRAGDAVGLTELLDEGITRAAAIVAEKNPDLDEATKTAVAHAVGIGAIKYTDLSNDRVRDYVFDWDRMLATSGDTAAYLQYTHARARSVLRRAHEHEISGAPLVLTEPAERRLALELLAFGDVVREVAETLRLHRLTSHLQTIAGAFTTFWDQCPVLRAEPGVRASRLALCDLTARTLAQGLDLLGIAAPVPM